MSIEIQQLGQMAHSHGRLSTSDDLDLLFDGKDPILSGDVMFSLDGIQDVQEGELKYSYTYELSAADILDLQGLIKENEAESSLQCIPSPDSQIRSPLHSDSGISDDQRSAASYHDCDGQFTDDLSQHGLTLETLDMSTILVGDDAMLITEAVVSSTVDSSDNCSDSVFPSSLSSSPTGSSKNLLPLTQKDVTFNSNTTYQMLVLTEEELRLLNDMNVSLPTDVALTKEEERNLKTVRRKIRNKASAQESRRKKKDYVDGLEQRVSLCTRQNRELQKKVDKLENDNQSIMSQLRRLQNLVSKTTMKTAQAGTCVMVLLMSFALLVAPRYNPFNGNSDGLEALTSRGTSRNLLQNEEPVSNIVPDADMSGSHSPKIFARTATSFDTSPVYDDEEQTIVGGEGKEAQFYTKSVLGSADENSPLTNRSDTHSLQLEGQMQLGNDDVADEAGDYTTTVVKRKIHVVNDEM